MCDLDAVGLLVNAVSSHSKNSKVVKNACLALASLVEIDGMYPETKFIAFV